MGEFGSLRDYWRLVQNPATRSSDPMELLVGAQSALRQFDDPHVIASALCVIIYRFLETESVQHLIDIGDIAEKYQMAKDGLKDVQDLPSVRWYLSLNMAVANLHLALDRSELALETLRENVARKTDAILRGQPFTNVVKSAAAALGIMKYRSPHRYSTHTVAELAGHFMGLGSDVIANYRFENQWVFEEISVVFRTLYSIAKVNYALKDAAGVPSAASILSQVDDISIPNSFLRLLQERRT